MTWTRRSVLRALGASSIAPLLSPVLTGSCATDSSGRRWQRSLDGIQPDEVRVRMRAVVADLSSRFSRATALATFRRAGRAMTDGDGRAAARTVRGTLVLQAEDTSTGQRFETVTHDLGPEGIARAHEMLRERATSRPGDPARLDAAPRDFASPVELDPEASAAAEWGARVDALYRESLRIGGSRVVYRGAYLAVDDTIEILIDGTRDLSQRLVRTRSGVVLIAQRGQRTETVPIVDIAEQSGLMGLEASIIPTEVLESAAERVTSLASPTAPPTGFMDVVLDPSCAALLAHRCVGEALRADLWLGDGSLAARMLRERVAAERVDLIDDPTLPGLYGSYFFDHEGRTPAPTPLIEKGILARPLADGASARLVRVEPTANARRTEPGRGLMPVPSNISFSPGTASVDQLVADVERGLLLEGVVFAHADPRTWHFVLRAGRGREIRAGKTTGVVYSDVDIRGRIPELLSAVRGLSRRVVRMPAPTAWPSTMGSPYLSTRAEVV